MAIDKDFVIKNGLQVNDNLIYANPDSDKVGIGTTLADKKLFVKGDSEITQSLTVGTGLSAVDGEFTGIITSNNGLDVGIGGSALSVNVSNKRVGINSTSPEYTVDIRGPVSTGTNAAYIFGDVEVTGNVTAANFTGQVQGGGDITLNNLTVRDNLVGNDANVYTFFKVNRFGGNNRFRFVPRDTSPVAIGFTENTDNPTLYLIRGQHYQFDLDSAGSPFYIKTSPTTGLGNTFGDGVENNGVQVGICTFKVPYNAPNILYYQSSAFSGGGGKIILNNDGSSVSSGDLTVSDTLTSQGQANFNNIDVTGIATINKIEGPNNFSVIDGKINVRQDETALIGVSTGSDKIQVDTANNARKFNITFVESPEQESDYKKLYVDTVDKSFAYNPNNNTLFVDKIETTGTISGVTTGTNDILVDISNEPVKYDIAFINNNGEQYRRLLKDSVSEEFSYNPNNSTLFVPNIDASKVTAPTLSGVSSGTDKVAITTDTSFPPNSNSRILFVTNANPDKSRFEEVFTNKDLKFNRGKGVLIANGFTGSGSTITNLNASNIASGTIGRQFLPDGDLTNKGAVKLNDNVDSTLTTEAATINAVNVAITTARNVIPSGSKMLFYNNAAPFGWTKVTDTGINNTALRVVAGNQANGGVLSTNDLSSNNLNNTNFTTIFTSRGVPLPQHTHVVNDPKHFHDITDDGHSHTYPKRFKIDESTVADGTSDNQILEDTNTENKPSTDNAFTNISIDDASTGITINSAGEANASMNFAVRYVDFLLCEKR